jgi:hypothetical protein
MNIHLSMPARAFRPIKRRANPSKSWPISEFIAMLGESWADQLRPFRVEDTILRFPCKYGVGLTHHKQAYSLHPMHTPFPVLLASFVHSAPVNMGLETAIVFLARQAAAHLCVLRCRWVQSDSPVEFTTANWLLQYRELQHRWDLSYSATA